MLWCNNAGTASDASGWSGVNDLQVQTEHGSHADPRAALRAEVRQEVRQELASVKQELRAEVAGWLEEFSLEQMRKSSGFRKPSSRTGTSTLKAGQASFDELRLKESIWDAALFIGVPDMGLGGSALVFLALLTNIFIQAIFLVIISERLVREEFSQEDLQGLRAWRFKIGHDSRFVSSSGPSLVDRVCNLDLTLEMATEQKVKLELIEEYLGGGEGGIDQFFGPAMCVLALTVWIMCILRELRSISDITNALWVLPRMTPQRMMLLPMPDGNVALSSVSKLRRAFFGLVLLLRLVVACMLLLIGTRYLCYTTSIGELFLNALALEQVINVDELIFDAMVPAAAKELIATLEPLRIRPWRRWKGADFTAVITPFVMLSLLAFSWSTSLKPSIDNLQAAQQALCGGTRNFSFAYDGLGVVHIESLPRYDAATAYELDSAASTAAQTVMGNTPWPTWSTALFSTRFGGGQAFMDHEGVEKMRATVVDIYRGRGYGTRYSTCHDALDRDAWAHNSTGVMENQWRTWPRYLERALGEPVRSCAQARRHCLFRPNVTHRAMAMMRGLCPVTCGCNSLLRGSVFVSEEFGCPPDCLSNPDVLEAETTPCSNVELNSSDYRLAFAASMLSEVGLATGGNYDASRDFLTYGCAFIQMIPDARVCLPEQNRLTGRFLAGNPFQYQVIKLLTHICPVECNCGGRLDPSAPRPPDKFCPSACICDWDAVELGVAIHEGAPEPNCTVPNLFAPTDYAPVATDGRCCHLMQQSAQLLRKFASPRMSTAPILDGAFLEIPQAERAFYLGLAGHLCVRCRRRCLALFTALTNLSAGQVCGVRVVSASPSFPGA